MTNETYDRNKALLNERNRLRRQVKRLEAEPEKKQTLLAEAFYMLQDVQAVLDAKRSRVVWDFLNKFDEGDV